MKDPWFQDYNAMSDDLRDDEETRCELHQQVDDLRERLWNICDERKEQAEKERGGLASDFYKSNGFRAVHTERLRKLPRK